MGIFKKIIEIFRKIVIGYIFYTFPLTLLGCVIIAKYTQGNPEEFLQEPYYAAFLNNLIYIAMAQFGIWTLISLLFSITMFFSRNNREIFLKRLSGIKERDEREVQIVGKALRVSYLSTMTILLFLLFISLFYVEYNIKSADNVELGQQRSSLAFGVEFSFLYPHGLVKQREGYDYFFSYRGLPLPTHTVILLLLVWQIVSYRFVSRRALKVPD